jgi:class 3 adenylate cyclase
VASCPACGKDLPGEFPFCPFCGAQLAETAGPRALEERKVVSVLFCDLVGFTAASDAADPEDVQARIRPYHARLRQEIERHGGTVEKFIGDAVMAVFGAPVAHEDDAERAVRSGLRILEAIDELNADHPTLSLQVRVGIHTGEAVVSLGARPELGEGMVTGDVVNTASRLQAVAPVNGVAVSEQTHRATERLFSSTSRSSRWW